MHAPVHFRVDDEAELAAFIEGRRFGALVVAGDQGPHAAHIPMLLNRDPAGKPVSLEGHVARTNPVAAIAGRPVRALAIFNGADAYVTPSLYPSKREHGKVVPTWNYIAVQVRGVLEAFSDADALRRQVGRITDMMEAPAAVPWKVDDAPADYLARMLGAITGLRLQIEGVAGVRKLSQNRSEGDRAGVFNGFAHSNDPSARQLALEMSKKA